MEECHFVAGPSELLIVTGIGISGIEIAKEIRLLPGQRCVKISLSPVSYEFNGHVVSLDGLRFNLSAVFTVAPRGDTEVAVSKFVKFMGRCKDQGGVHEAIRALIEENVRSFAASMTMSEMFRGRALVQELMNDIQTSIDEFGMVIGSGHLQPGPQIPNIPSTNEAAGAKMIDTKKTRGLATHNNSSIGAILATRNLAQGCGAVGFQNYAMQKEFRERESQMQNLWLMRGKEKLAEKAAELMNPDDPSLARAIYDRKRAEMEVEEHEKDVEKKKNTESHPLDHDLQAIEKKTEALFLLDNLRGDRATAENERKVMPWLLLRDDNASSTLKLYNLEENRGDVKVIEELCEREICTACDGWAVISDVNSPHCFLLNVESLHKIDLPCPNEKIEYWICILSGPPTEIDSAVAFLGWDRYSITYCGVEDTGWNEKQLDEYVESMTVVKKKIFVLHDNGSLVMLDIDTGRLETKMNANSGRGIRISRQFPSTYSGYHMIELSGTLFLIASRMSRDHQTPKHSRVEGVEVYEMDSVKEIWKVVRNIENSAFLVAEDSNCASVIAREHVKPNSIYFLKFQGSELKVFDMATKTISSIITLPQIPSRWVVMLSSFSLI